MNKRGFTLIELLVVIAIIAVLVAFAAINYVGIREKAKDLRKKTELGQVKNAMLLYFNEYANYPGPSTTTTNDLYGCGAADPPTSSCATECDGQFAAGATGCDTVYMKLLPPDTDYDWSYRQISSGDNFCLWTTLENESDAEIAKSQLKCTGVCSGIAPAASFVLCAD